MVVYHIFLRNKYSQGGQGQDYTLWRETPFVQSENQLEVVTFSNSFSTRNVTSDGVWNIDINDVPYAYCGNSSSRPLSLGDIPDATGHKMVKVLSEGNGSTVSVYNNEGRPAFRPDPQYTASPATYNLVTEKDFTDNLKFVGGFSGNDGDGQSRAWATFEINPLTSYSVRPTPVFYLGDFASKPGALVDVSLAQNYIAINFAANPGQQNAIVEQGFDGTFKVDYVNAAVFAMAVASTETTVSSQNVQLTQLKSQAKLLSDLIDAALGISTTSISVGKYRCHFQWRNNPSAVEQKVTIALLKARMIQEGYKDAGSSPDTPSLDFSHTPDLPLPQVLVAWVTSFFALPPPLSHFATLPWVERIQFASTTATQPESLSFSPDKIILPDPQWRCSLEWIEGPIEGVKNEIARQLGNFMNKREYLTWPAEISEGGITIDVRYLGAASSISTKADWQAAYDSLEFLKMYAFNPQVEPIVWLQDGSQSVSNGVTSDEVSASSAPFPLPTFIGRLNWLEGPNKSTRNSIIASISEALSKQGCNPGSVRDDGKSLNLIFTHARPYDLDRATVAWQFACNTVPPFQRHYITNIRCEEAFTPQGGDVAVDTFLPPELTYVGYLTWLEGAPRQTRDRIIQIISSNLNHRSYRIGFVDVDSPRLSIFFSHGSPSDLTTARQDWRHAYDAVEGNLRMYVSDPRCEDPFTIQNNGEGALTEPNLPMQSSYIGAINWLESPNKATKDSIIDQLKATLTEKGSHVLNVIDLHGNEVLLIVFENQGSPDLQRATTEWLAAYASVTDIQRMFITNPRCEINGDAQTTRTSGLDVITEFLGGLEWLEGPGESARRDIIQQLLAALRQRGYDTYKAPIDFAEFLVLPFYYPQSRTPEEAKADWLAAYGSVNEFQRMYITRPWCEEDSIVHDEKTNQAVHSTNGSREPTTAAAAAPAAIFSQSIAEQEQDETIAAKKRRALALLEREGLVEFGSAMGLQ